VLHAKMLIIDEWVVLGSSNMNHRSLLHDLEADIVITQDVTKEELCHQFKNDLRKTQEVSMDDWKQQKWAGKAAGRTLYAMRYWL
jgi:cardiolipin synthase